mgnify:CR=1 FL=1
MTIDKKLLPSFEKVKKSRRGSYARWTVMAISLPERRAGYNAYISASLIREFDKFGIEYVEVLVDEANELIALVPTKDRSGFEIKSNGTSGYLSGVRHLRESMPTGRYVFQEKLSKKNQLVFALEKTTYAFKYGKQSKEKKDGKD